MPREKRRRMRDEAGFEAWVWLVVMVANFMFCGGEAWEARRCVHAGRRTAVQEKRLHGHELRVARFLGVDTAVSPGDRGDGDVRRRRGGVGGVGGEAAAAVHRGGAVQPPDLVCMLGHGLAAGPEERHHQGVAAGEDVALVEV